MTTSHFPAGSTTARVAGSAVLCAGAVPLVAYPLSNVLWSLPLGSTALYNLSAWLIPLGAVLTTWGLSVVSTGKLRSLTVRRAIPATLLAPLTYAVAEFHPDPLQPDTIGWAPPSTASELAYQVVYSGGYAMPAVPLLFVVAVATARDRRNAAVVAVGVLCAYLLALVPGDVAFFSIHPFFWLPLVVLIAAAVAVGHWGAKPLETNETDGASADED